MTCVCRKKAKYEDDMDENTYKNMSFAAVINLFKNRTKFLIRRQAFASLQHGFLRSEGKCSIKFGSVSEKIIYCIIQTEWETSIYINFAVLYIIKYTYI